VAKVLFAAIVALEVPLACGEAVSLDPLLVVAPALSQ
jgi:hypothetical protein